MRNTDLHFLLVRPMGVDPAEPQRGSYALLTGRGQGGLELLVAKEDVALLLGISGIFGYDGCGVCGPVEMVEIRFSTC